MRVGTAYHGCVFTCISSSVLKVVLGEDILKVVLFFWKSEHSKI